jgi:hypothetical protein
MPTAKSRHHAKDPSTRPGRQVDGSKEIKHDIVEHLTEYVRHNPGYAALCCVGVGFVLGWKLKPW